MNSEQNNERTIIDDNRNAMFLSIISISILTIFLSFITISFLLLQPIEKDYMVNMLIFYVILLWIFYICFLIYLGLFGKKSIRKSTFTISNNVIEIGTYKRPKFSVTWDKFKSVQVKSFKKTLSEIAFRRRYPFMILKTHFEIIFLGINASKSFKFITGYQFSKKNIRKILYLLRDFAIERKKNIKVIIESEGFGKRLLSELNEDIDDFFYNH